MRRTPLLTAALAAGSAGVLVLGLSACGNSSGGNGGKSTSGNKFAGLKLGGPPECPTRPFCEPGLKQTYGMKIASFKKLDTGGPLTIKAIKDGTVDFGLVFTSDPTVAAQGLTVLTDDKNLQASDNIVPIVGKSFAKAPVTSALNTVDAKLSQVALVAMNRAVGAQHVAPEQVASGFLSTLHLNTKAALCGGKSGSGSITVGAFNFSESELLGNIYAAALKVCGYSTKVKALGAREVVYPALKKGQLDLVPEYAATLTDFIATANKSKVTSSGDITKTMRALRGELPASLVALTPAPATDKNAFAVTKAFATAHNISTMSQLAAYSHTGS
jgi:glycine betaine/choline ABC-type transport system substrate-binding protein